MISQALQTKKGAWLTRSLFSELPRGLCPWQDVQGTHYAPSAPLPQAAFSGAVVLHWGDAPHRGHLSELGGMVWHLVM